MSTDKLPITVLIATKNEAVNLPKCLSALSEFERVVLLDSNSHDSTPEIAERFGAEIVQFSYAGGYPKKRQWALDTLDLRTGWVLLLDADEVVPEALSREIRAAIGSDTASTGYLIKKGFHFFGRRFRYGGFSHAAVLLFRTGSGKFEHLLDELSLGTLDMEVHERIIIDGAIGELATPLIHEDYKGLEAYIDRHNKYSTWEAAVRSKFLNSGEWGESSIRPRLFGNTQERRRWLKKIAMRVPGEAWLWFLYHYVFRLGFLEGRAGFVASQIRSQYISNVRAKIVAERVAS